MLCAADRDQRVADARSAGWSLAARLLAAGTEFHPRAVAVHAAGDPGDCGVGGVWHRTPRTLDWSRSRKHETTKTRKRSLGFVVSWFRGFVAVRGCRHTPGRRVRLVPARPRCLSSGDPADRSL